MVNNIRKIMRKIYEKNNSTLGILCFISRFFLIITLKNKNLNDEMIEAMSDHLKDKELSKKELKKIKKEIVLFRLIYKVRPNEYFLYETSRRTPEERRTYISREMTNGYYKQINDFDALNIFNDKFLSYKVFNELYRRDVLYVPSDDKKNEFLEFIKRNKRFVLKPVDGHGGVGVEFINVKDYKTPEELFEHTKAAIPYIVEEIVEQHEKMACFHPQSLNTVRVVTFQKDGHVSIVWSFFRVGQGDSNVDNMTSGGFGAQVDPLTGKIITDAIDYRGDKVTHHPDSNIKFKGYQIPDWEGLVSTLEKLSAKVPSVHCIGWDMAYSKKGWELVEANGRAQVVTIQVLTGEGFLPLFKKMAYLCNKDEEETDY